MDVLRICLAGWHSMTLQYETGEDPADDGYECISSVFDVAFYLERYDDIAAALSQDPNFDPVQHYLTVGWQEGRDPHPAFSTSYYLEANPDVAASGLNPFYHYLSQGHAEGRLTQPRAGELSDEQQKLLSQREAIAREFDLTFYLSTYPDLGTWFAATPGFDPVLHYLTTGWLEGRDPSPRFSTSYYLEANPDVAASNQNPFYHFLTSGRAEGRIGQRPIHTTHEAAAQVEALEADRASLDLRQRIAREFDVTFYLNENPDLAEQFSASPTFDPILHYIRVGWREGRDPHPSFSTVYYVDNNPEAITAGENPFAHYIDFGRANGRQGKREPVALVDGAENVAASAHDVQEVALPETNSQSPMIQAERDLIAAEFDVAYYIATYPDVAAELVKTAGFDPVLHFLTSGWLEGRNPNERFSTRFYLGCNPDVASSGANPFSHYLSCGRAEGRSPMPTKASSSEASSTEEAEEARDELSAARDLIASEFDVVFYLKSNPDIAKSAATVPGFDPVRHYLTTGWREGRDPHPEFSTSHYLRAYSDHLSEEENPFVDYLVRGRAEGRIARPVADGPLSDLPVPTVTDKIFERARELIAVEFDAHFYVARNPDLATGHNGSEIDLVLHYLTAGWREGRDPHPEFCTAYYLETNPDVAASGENPFLHYILAGRSEGRLGKAPGGHRARYLKSLRTLSQQADAWRTPGKPRVLRSANRMTDLIRPDFPDGGRLIVSLSHDDYARITGGVQLCLRREANAFKAAGDCYLHLYPTQPSPTIAPLAEDYRLNVNCDGRGLGTTNQAEAIQAIAALSAIASEVVVVVHALHGHSPEFVCRLAEALPGASYIFWVHDYLSLCSGYTLTRNGIAYCGPAPVGSPACGVCVYGEDRSEHLTRVRSMFAAVPFVVVAPSQSALQIWSDNSNLVAAKTVVHPHCQMFARTTMHAPAVRSGPLRIGFLGMPTLQKGWPVFQSLVDRFGSNFEFYYFGERDCGDARVTWVPVSAGDGLEASPMTEAVATNELDYAIIWSIAPETFCFTAYEALAGGARILTNRDAGNVVHLVTKEQAGLVLADQAELHAFMSALCETLPDQVRQSRPSRADLKYSRLTLDVLATEVPARSA